MTSLFIGIYLHSLPSQLCYQTCFSWHFHFRYHMEPGNRDNIKTRKKESCKLKISDDFRLRKRVWPLLWWFTTQSVYQDIGLEGGLPWIYSNGLYKHFTNICSFLENSELCHPKPLGYSIHISWVDAVNTNQKGNWHFCLFLFPSDALNVSIHIGESEDDSGQGIKRRQKGKKPLLLSFVHSPANHPLTRWSFSIQGKKKKLPVIYWE